MSALGHRRRRDRCSALCLPLARRSISRCCSSRSSLLSSASAALKVHAAAHHQRLDDVGVVRGRFRVAAAARPARDDARRRRQRVQPVPSEQQGTQPAAPHAVQHGVAGLTVQGAGLAFRLLGDAAPSPTLVAIARPLVGAATVYFLLNTGLVATAIALSTRDAIATTWHDELSLERAELLRRRRHGGRWPRRWSHAGYWVAPLTFAPIYLTYRTYKVYMGRIEDEQRHVQQTSDLHLATIEALARAIDAKDQTTQMHIRRVQLYAAGLARAVGLSRERDSGRQDRGAAARHRQARGARAHPVEARAADAGGVPEDPHPSRRSAREIIAAVPFPVSGRAADPEPPRALGRQRLSAGSEGRRDSDRRAHPDDRRLLRRRHDRAAVSQGADATRAPSACSSTKRAARSIRRSSPMFVEMLPALVAEADAEERELLATARDDASRARRRPAPASCRSARAERVREHRAGASRNLRAVRNRAVDGHEPRRRPTRWRSSRRS